jgi:hypothetical protein
MHEIAAVRWISPTVYDRVLCLECLEKQRAADVPPPAK